MDTEVKTSFKKMASNYAISNVAKKKSKRDKNDPLQSEKVIVRRSALNADIDVYLKAGGKIHIIDNPFPDGTPRPKHLDHGFKSLVSIVRKTKKVSAGQGPRTPVSGKDNLSNRYI